MDLQLQDKTAFISGSTAGIGLAIAEALLKEKATVIINGRTTEAVEKTVSALKATYPGARVTGIPADFGIKEDVAGLLDKLPSIDILINNVGIFEPKAFVDIPDEDWFRFFDVNVMSGVRLARRLFPAMLKKNWGRIIFVSSESAVFIPDEMIHYGMTKTAQLSISRGLAELTKGTNVTVNSILPGPTRSRGVGDFVTSLAKQDNVSFDEMEKKFFQQYRPTSLIQRFATTEEVANMVAYLVSPLASATNGAAIRVEGGLVRSAI
ncbi:SDR family oxidoreductase [Flavitalea sp. BT771]|uniref:SDR family NAD(P)-dependent oxidoreductase n=1 Tax=Flavitalea sp. BT771 TaxID=3063329 RepID=UPI0026E25557|nr:SDR family oxidoreductase [Flavitalea sp. BT771]MDO6433669.1 SDR family oxidoreductase [Flavitalea sp. BT771]MDV6222426.1 SDR family oxidoreductase [Flavitalea sp. BT771]